MPPNDAMQDQELQLKKRARRRLVGAIALVVLMVIILPMVLEDRAKTTQTEKIAVSIPSLDTTEQADPVNIPKETLVTPVPEQPVENKIESVESSPPTQTSMPQGSESASQKQEEIKPAVKSEAGEKSMQEQASAPQKENQEKSIDGVHYYVQIGVFSDPDNVKKMQSKLQELGYKSLTEKAHTPKGDKIRLRTTVFKDRNEAAIALQNIKDAGLSGMVVSQK